MPYNTRSFFFTIFIIFIIIIFSFLSYGIINKYQKEKIILEHIQWIESNTTLEYNGEKLPKIEKLPRSNLIARFYNIDPNPEKHTDRDKRILKNSKIIALYSPDKDTMYFTKNFNVKDWETKHILVHELIHYMQDINGFELKNHCNNGLEAFAYHVQSKWQIENNHPLPRPSRILIARLIASCYQR